MKLKFFKNTTTMKRSQYTQQEIAELKEIAKTTINVYADSRKFAKKIGKSEKSVYNRIYRERMDLGIATSKTKQVVVNEPLEKITFFYTKKQVSLITEALKDGLTASETTRKFAISWGLSFHALYSKVKRIKDGLKKPARVPKATIIVKQEAVEQNTPVVQEMDLQMTEGSTFDCKPSRVTICKDHIRIYF